MRLSTASYAPAWLAMLVGLGSCTLAGRYHAELASIRERHRSHTLYERP